jgi:hypothetical protein
MAQENEHIRKLIEARDREALAEEQPFAMFVDLQNKYDWVLQPVIGYSSVDRLIEVLEDKIVRPAEAKFNELLARRTKQLSVEKV